MNSSSLTANKSPYQTSNSSTSTLRPRNNRLISYLDDDSSSALLDDASESTPTATSFPPRGVSPLPNIGRTRSVAQNSNPVKGKQVHSRSVSDQKPVLPVTSLWDPWSSLQGIASSLLGSEIQPKGKEPDFAKPSSRRNQATAPQATTEWGPILDHAPQVMPGSSEERLAMMQAKRREVLLLADANEGRDVNGRYKRRDSNSDFSSYMDSSSQEDDGLAFVHTVQPTDTMAGVSIKFSCQPEIFRKVNRFWPNDNIQMRKHVFLPVDACSIRSKKMDSNFDLLSAGLESLGNDTSTASTDYMLATSIVSSETVQSPPTQIPSPTSLIENSRHESWVELPGFSEPVEILRLPRRTLGYFPPARRKSNASPSMTSTPKSSFDMLRHPPTHAASLNASPVRRPKLSSQNARQRSSSTTTTRLSFADHLKGPGGVGTLHGLRTEVSRPGPGQDPLNRQFAPYLPDLAPPEAFPRTSLRPTPRASTDSVRSTSSAGLGEMGGAIEVWVRKLAGPKSGKPATAKMGDLIELETNSEMGDLLEDRGEGQTPTQQTALTGTANAIEEAMLNERFPVRGRVRNAYTRAKDDS